MLSYIDTEIRDVTSEFHQNSWLMLAETLAYHDWDFMGDYVLDILYLIMFIKVIPDLDPNTSVYFSHM